MKILVMHFFKLTLITGVIIVSPLMACDTEEDKRVLTPVQSSAIANKREMPKPDPIALALNTPFLDSNEQLSAEGSALKKIKTKTKQFRPLGPKRPMRKPRNKTAVNHK